MSGHSKWSTIKHKKEAEDQKRGKVFSKLSKAISVAVKVGGGNDPDTNHKLRMAIDAARQANMPKANIERALSNATDNRNRTSQEISGILDKGGGRLAGPGAVSYNFDQAGYFLIEKKKDIDGQMLKLIDMGAGDVEEVSDSIEVYVKLNDFSLYRDKLKESEQKILSSGMMQKPKATEKVEDSKKVDKLIKLMESLEDHDDVQNVYTNADIDEELLE
jgi:transcriptional/translational regulatory protein YebC/TACO1